MAGTEPEERGAEQVRVDVARAQGFLLQLVEASRGLAHASSVTTFSVGTRGRAPVLRVEVAPARADDDALRAAGLDLWGARVGLASCGVVVTDLAEPGMRGWELSFAAHGDAS